MEATRGELEEEDGEEDTNAFFVSYREARGVDAGGAGKVRPDRDIPLRIACPVHSRAASSPFNSLGVP
jgi:hypothetical protein